tara:strand:+ start:8429 stop:9004 length:576 start_codon:yes stop_codon:yes gene_type:complete
MKFMKTYKILMTLAFLINYQIVAQELVLDTSLSKLKWTGTEITSKTHYGSLIFKSGTITMKNNKPVKGEFVVDMTTLKNEDVPEAYRGRLEGHLKSDDFFSVDKFPEAVLKINSSSFLNSEKYNLEGDLTVKGITHPISLSITTMKNKWIANLTFDRSKYDVRFRSGTFFENLGDKLIYDDIIIESELIFK